MDKTSLRSYGTYIRNSDHSCRDADSIVNESNEYSDCGEALTPQHLEIDFTPGDLDTELMQTKCCAFWDFIRSHPGLEKFKVMPDKEQKEASDRNELDTVESSLSTPIKLGRTAVSMLELAEAKGYMVPAFQTTGNQPFCSYSTEQLGPCDFALVLPPTKLGKHGCKCPGPCVECEKTQAENKTAPSVDVGSLCQKMETWDQNNPKHPHHASQKCYQKFN